MVDEQTRLSKVGLTKQKNAFPVLEFSNVALQVLTHRSRMEEFNHTDVASSPESSLYESSDEEVEDSSEYRAETEGNKRGFSEIHGMKARVMRKKRTFEEPKSIQLLRSMSTPGSPKMRLIKKASELEMMEDLEENA